MLGELSYVRPWWMTSVRNPIMTRSSRFSPDIAALDVWGRTATAACRGEIPAADMVDAALRHHLYELNIGAQHLAFHAWTGDDDNLAAVAHHTA